MIRFDAMSQDCLSLPNGRNSHLKLIREEGHHPITPITAPATATAGANQSYKNSSTKAPTFPAFENRAARVRPSPDPSAAQVHTFPQSPSRFSAAVAPLQWGNRKRSRGTRVEPFRAALEEPPASDPRPTKVPRRSATAGSHSKGVILRSSTPSRDPSGPNPARIVDERSSSKKSPPRPAEKMQRTATRGGAVAGDLTNAAVTSETAAERSELPKILLTLSRKEKEEDFLLMKGTKLPQRPKKRLKSVEKSLQYIYPGMWLSDLSRGRYEVREKKCAKKKRRGLKGMESMDSDSY